MFRSKVLIFGSHNGKLRNTVFRTFIFYFLSSFFRFLVFGVSSWKYVQFCVENPMFRSKLSNSASRGEIIRKSNSNKLSFDSIFLFSYFLLRSVAQRYLRPKLSTRFSLCLINRCPSERFGRSLVEFFLQVSCSFCILTSLQILY